MCGTRGLVAQQAASELQVDEQQREVEAAMAAERTARLAVLTAKAQLQAAESRVNLAKADLADARAALRVADARLSKELVNLKYAKIVAPFDGVVTRRTFHPGALIHSATEGGKEPLFTVQRTDMMRVAVLIPDRDVVRTHVNDPAVVNVDALGGQSFAGTLGGSPEPKTPSG